MFHAKAQKVWEISAQRVYLLAVFLTIPGLRNGVKELCVLCGYFAPACRSPAARAFSDGPVGRHFASTPSLLIGRKERGEAQRTQSPFASLPLMRLCVKPS